MREYLNALQYPSVIRLNSKGVNSLTMYPCTPNFAQFRLSVLFPSEGTILSQVCIAFRFFHLIEKLNNPTVDDFSDVAMVK